MMTLWILLFLLVAATSGGFGGMCPWDIPDNIVSVGSGFL